IQGAPQAISARLVDSLNQPLVNVLDPINVASTFVEYRGYGLVPPTSNTDTPPDEWIDYQLILPTSVDIYLTSFQLVSSGLPVAYPYEEDSIDRQNDHTWHYYANEVIVKPKDTILTAWNFSLNPFQFNSTSVTTASSQTQYIADQTILHQIASGGTLASGKASVANRQCLLVQAVTGHSSNRFALIQY